MMQEVALLLSATLDHAERVFPETEIISGQDGVAYHRYRYADAAERSRRLASALLDIGLVGEDTFLGALGFNTYRMFEVMHAVPGSGAILHTANPRLHDDHLIYTINHAQDRALFVDLDCLELARRIASKCRTVKQWIVLCDRKDMPALPDLPSALCVEELIDSGNPNYCWPQFDERQASAVCFTSGTTGEPKGVLYSHRGTLLNIMTVSGKNGWDLGRGDCVLAGAPFFHCNGWGMPYLAPMVGANLVLPGRNLSAASMLSLIKSEQVTHSGGVPTILADLLHHAQHSGLDLAPLRQLWTGATAPSESLIAQIESLGPKVRHAFGMTETTQALTVSIPDPRLPPSAQRAEQMLQGQPVFLSDCRVVAETENNPTPSNEPVQRNKDMQADNAMPIGAIEVRGPAVATGYLRRPELKPLSADGWLDTGDIGTIGPHKQLQITDRAKDVIKSGGEWISSVELENHAQDCPGISQAACVGVPHPRWQERPVLLLVKDPLSDTHAVDAEMVRAHMADKIASWWMPDEIVFVEDLPRNGTGKVIKAQLRDKYRHQFNKQADQA